ncbi:MAG: GNAT family N-acetyltransferase [Patulibacter minatonensis]
MTTVPSSSRTRFAQAADVPAVVALVESAYRGDASRAGWTSEADLLDGQRTDAEMVAAAIARRGVHVLLLEGADGGELLACCELTAPGGQKDSAAAGTRGDEPDRGGAHPVPTVHLGMFAVQPGLQDHGIGRAVVDEAVRISRDVWQAEVLELCTIAQRTELIAWYERRGFARTGELRPFPYGEPRYGLPRRDDLVQVVMQRRLAAAGTSDPAREP